MHFHHIPVDCTLTNRAGSLKSFQQNQTEMWPSYACVFGLYAALLLGSSNAAASTYWLANKPNVGTVAFQTNLNYPVFRNVKDYGARGECSQR